MSQLPDESNQTIFELAGTSHQKTGKKLTMSLLESLYNLKKDNLNPQEEEEIETKYDEDYYPHFLPSDNIKNYTLRVSIKDTNPPIWRKFRCPSNISLRHLSELIIELMGWEGIHLNCYIHGRNKLYIPSYQYINEMSLFGDILYQEEFKLSDLLHTKGQAIRWKYDFCDEWNIEIRLSSIDEYTNGDDPLYIFFKKGKGACPPENCGGLKGYKELIEIYEKKRNNEHLTSKEKKRLKLYGMDGDFYPEYYYYFEGLDICDSFSCEDDWDDDQESEYIEGPGLFDLLGITAEDFGIKDEEISARKRE